MAEKLNIKSYRDLIIWQRTKSSAVLIYKITEKFPTSELYGITSQMRRAAVSMPSNIAEGFRRKSVKEKLQFLRMAYGSGAELETQLEISRDLGYLSDQDYKNLSTELDQTMKMMNRTINTLEN
ncbi:MAG: four helix bundle protein [Candidatus Liptonbacteria bacterium]|nr:four helix bundle protein [Candidatus Liptonbacteria bacterium]